MGLLSVVLLTSLVSPASAQGTGSDVLTLSSGERIVGELLDVRDGKYWVLQGDGQIVSLDFRTVQTVQRGGAALPQAEAVPIDELPLPSWNAPAKAPSTKRPIEGGFDFGFTTGARVRFNLKDSKAASSVDLKLGVAPVVGGALGALFHTGPELALFGRSTVHMTLSASVGLGLIWGSFYPYAGVGTGLSIDPRGPFELHIGFEGGLTSAYFAFSPEITTSWMW